ncbi:grifin [Nomascus leucogenys]|uniref:grifin n=1 Tax=Nomascus leucogenys TaxID=61853 RepID=UPI00122DA68B|nr:grifin [Nomascus leucogenys]
MEHVGWGWGWEGGGCSPMRLVPLSLPLSLKPSVRGGLAPGWNLLVQGHADSGEDRFETNFLLVTGDIAFHVKPQFSSATMVGNAFQDGRWGPEELSSIFPLAPGEPFEVTGAWPACPIEVSSDAEHFHIYAPEHKVLQFPGCQRPLGAITRVHVLSDHRLAQVELAKRGLSWGSTFNKL